MSNRVFPPDEAYLTDKIAWNNTKTPLFTTLTQMSSSGRESRVMQEVYPRWQFEVEFKGLFDDEPHGDQVNAMYAFFLQHHGQYETFLYKDTQDNHLEEQQIGVGDGTQRVFQIVRSMGGIFAEPIFDIDASSLEIYHYIGGIKTPILTGWEEDNGRITFDLGNEPTGPVLVTCDFYYRVRFSSDELTLEQLLTAVWRSGTITLVSVKP